MIRGVLAVILGLVTFTTVGVVLAAPAQAAVSCSGTLSYSRTIDKVGGGSIGELAIYYNTTNGGTNSACFYHRGVAYGIAAPTYVRAFRCAEQSGEGQPCTIVASSTPDFSDDYRYYAGPRGVTGTANYCVAAVGYIDWGAYRYAISSGRQGC
jgi:hypothetical protein